MHGTWTNDGSCVATRVNANCGPGNQRQTRTCTDGTTDKCTEPEDTERFISCALTDCIKQHSPWINDTGCVAKGDNPNCGPGNQRQTRTCTDGTTDKCTKPEDKERFIFCALPDCIKQHGPWNNDGGCVATGEDPTCGSGNQRQTRTCIDGTTDNCTAPNDTERNISCKDAQTELPECSGRD